ncbi:MAG: hypothetical protein HXY40_19440 [Chloroflexi bacterium]|nr:hypothetical protein [Chloroflexota bacterium]
MSRVMIVTTLPEKDVEKVLDAIAGAGGGQIGEYTHCAFTSGGSGRFKPSAAANPHVGTIGTINAEPEVRIETFCARTQAKAVVQAMRAAHPYEEPVIYVLPLLDEAEL